MTIYSNQYLLVDADDTLWENNRYFEAAILDFVTFLNHEQLSGSQIREILDEFERASLVTHGYGARSFAHSLRQTFQHITGAADEDPLLQQAEQHGLRILDQELEHIAGVAETLAALRPHHQLALLTKGNIEEQQAKIDRSGLVHLFDSTQIVEEKSVETYRDILKSATASPQETWMIGNSPRSDINPALNAGLNAVFIPHEMTWHLEIEQLAELDTDAGGVLLQLEKFADLQNHFVPSEHGNASQG